jgi:hypothetical protein
MLNLLGFFMTLGGLNGFQAMDCCKTWNNRRGKTIAYSNDSTNFTWTFQFVLMVKN